MGILNLFKSRKKDKIDVNNSLVCQAPFKSIRFEHSGKVIASCYNRGYILGEFPKDSLKSIWFGQKLQDLRENLYQNNFSLGCQTCERNITNGNRSASGAAEYDYLQQWENLSGFPVMFDFEIGSTCNFECIMCSGEYSSSIRKNREGKSVYEAPFEENIDLFVEQLVPFLPQLKEMRFVGGEPFLMRSHYKIWDKVLEINPKIQLNITTNGSILNKRVQNMLEKGNFKVSVSLDSIVKETFEAIRINSDFDEVFSNAKFFQKLNNERGHVMNYNLCVMRQNWHEIPEYFLYCNSNEIQVVLHTVEFPLHCAIWNLPSENLREIVALYDSIVFDSVNDDEISKKNINTFKSLSDQIRSWYKFAENKESQPIINDLKTLQGELRRKFENTNMKERSNTVDYYYNFILEICNEFDEDGQKAIIKSISQMRTELLFSEINVSTKERIYERFKLITLHKEEIENF